MTLCRVSILAMLCILSSGLAFAADKPIVVALSPDGLSLEEREPLQAYLTKQMGREVRIIIPNNSSEYLSGFATGSIDFASLESTNYVRAHAKVGVIPLVRRTTDLESRSVFITGMTSAIKSLTDLKGKQFAFGDIYSTSGHIVPMLEMKKAGINQESDLKFRYTAGHPNTAKLVETGVVDAGAMDELIYKSMIASGKLDRTRIRVFYTSRSFADSVYVARKDIAMVDRTKFSKALESLKESDNAQVLRILRAKQFIPANDQEYEPVRQMASNLNLLD